MSYASERPAGDRAGLRQGTTISYPFDAGPGAPERRPLVAADAVPLLAEVVERAQMAVRDAENSVASVPDPRVQRRLRFSVESLRGAGQRLEQFARSMPASQTLQGARDRLTEILRERDAIVTTVSELTGGRGAR